ncbi:hypothetical protein [Romboutsia sp. 1001713B170131_170501_G6]|uniref:hypothetical protein n=1 Tax=Romboutsia sp. 1001713B170131_170501_G6 TaxID=2787108 RepID=UPI0018A8C9ED|nr:hypothetical protein [Romboutsia sp. 1001713B170131_170501_G6]
MKRIKLMMLFSLVISIIICSLTGCESEADSEIEREENYKMYYLPRYSNDKVQYERDTIAHEKGEISDVAKLYSYYSKMPIEREYIMERIDEKNKSYEYQVNEFKSQDGTFTVKIYGLDEMIHNLDINESVYLHGGKDIKKVEVDVINNFKDIYSDINQHLNNVEFENAIGLTEFCKNNNLDPEVFREEAKNIMSENCGYNNYIINLNKGYFIKEGAISCIRFPGYIIPSNKYITVAIDIETGIGVITPLYFK